MSSLQVTRRGAACLLGKMYLPACSEALSARAELGACSCCAPVSLQFRLLLLEMCVCDVPELLCAYSHLLRLLLQSDVQLIKTGDKVGASEATLLNMLNISPFSFGLVIQQVFDNGSIYNPEVLDITEETLHKRFLEVSAAAHLPCVLPRCCSSQHCPRVKCHLRCVLRVLRCPASFSI